MASERVMPHAGVNMNGGNDKIISVNFLILFFQVDKSRQFRREGADVHSDVHISLSQAVLGGTIKIPGIYEDILLNVSRSVSTHCCSAKYRVSICFVCFVG